MFNSKAHFTGLCLLCAAGFAHAQDCHIALRGHVMEADTKEPLAYASVFIREVQKGTTTDETGYYAIPDLCENTRYTVEVNHVECAHQTQVIRLTENAEMDFNLAHNAVLPEVLVHERATAPAPTQAENTVSKADLEAGKGVNLGETLKRLPGVTTLNTGATIAKPVIQGLHSNRIAIVSNNVILEGQQWGSEHAPEVDPFSADKISVVKGAAGVRYGVGAMAGAIILEPAPLRETSGMGGWLSLGTFSNGRSGVLAGSTDWHLPGKSLTFRLQGTLKRSGNLRAPDYFLGNTGVAEYNFSSIAGWKSGQWTHEISFSRFNQQLGILRSAHISDTTSFGEAIRSDVPLNNRDEFSWRISRPYQLIQHNVLKYRTIYRISEKWKLSGQYTWQYNNRREYDAHPPLSDPKDLLQKSQLSFRIWTNMLDLALEHFPIRHWQGGVGVQAIHQLNFVGKGGLIPDYRTFGGSIWAMERWRRYPNPWEFEFGARYDYRSSIVTTTGNGSNNLDEHLVFGNMSGTAGAVYHLSRNIRLSLNSGFAWRPPHVNELYAEGVHHGSATYERGNPDFKPEKAWNTNLNVQYQYRKTDVMLTLYRNAVRDFIYLDPQKAFVRTIRGTFPLYTYAQNNAVLYGFDANFSVPVLPAWSVESRISVLRGYAVKSDSTPESEKPNWLPLMPTDRFQYGIKWNLHRSDKSGATTGNNNHETYIRLMAMTSLRQTRYLAGSLFKDPPPTFTTLSFDAGHTFFFGKRSLEVGLNIQNLTNTRYREYLNFFRYYADEPGFNAGLRAKFIFG
ncbi:MAG: TonB-dependent receptor [Saprospiraceae bacterium]|nr:TonB-dependent receptor [Saprospiraceae bacterium]